MQIHKIRTLIYTVKIQETIYIGIQEITYIFKNIYKQPLIAFDFSPA